MDKSCACQSGWTCPSCTDEHNQIIHKLNKEISLWETEGDKLVEKNPCYETTLLAATWKDRAKDIRDIINKNN